MSAVPSQGSPLAAGPPPVTAPHRGYVGIITATRVGGVIVDPTPAGFSALVQSVTYDAEARDTDSVVRVSNLAPHQTRIVPQGKQLVPAAPGHPCSILVVGGEKRLSVHEGVFGGVCGEGG